MKLNNLGKWIYWLIILNMILIGCTVGPKYQPPEFPLPEAWASPLSEGMHETPSDDFLWWESFNDPLLNALIERASVQNLDLHLALSRILEARTQKNAKKGDAYPHIDFSTNYDHVYYSKDALVNGLIGAAIPIHSHHVKRNVDFFEIGFDADWEIDFFGVTEHELKALQALEEASEETFCDVWITLSAEIAKNYIELRGYQQQLLLLDKNIETQTHTIYLSNELIDSGVISQLDASQSKSQLNELRAKKPLLELGSIKAINRLSTLLGESSQDLTQELNNCYKLPSLPYDKPVGVPSELLRRRPDIRKAERELAAATERVGSAIASLFPRFSLRGFIGDISTHAGSILSPASATWIAGPQLLLPIFNSRLLLQDIDYNKIQVEKSVYQYQKTVLEALEETENALASYHFELEHYSELFESYQNNLTALKLTQQLYTLGIKDNLSVLTATKELIAAENAFTQSQLQLLIHYISLYKALGGTWQPQVDDVCSTQEIE